MIPAPRSRQIGRGDDGEGYRLKPPLVDYAGELLRCQSQRGVPIAGRLLISAERNRLPLQALGYPRWDNEAGGFTHHRLHTDPERSPPPPTIRTGRSGKGE